MTTPTVACYLFGYNLDAIQYPWRESIASATDLADAVYFAACDPDTLTAATALAEHNPKLHIVEDSWGTHFSVQAYIANRLLDAIGTKYDFALKLDADEVLHESSFESFRADLRAMRGGCVSLGRPEYVHFCPDFETTWPFIYRTKAVLSFTISGIRFNTNPAAGNADACALGGAREFQTSLVIHHYGKVQIGREREALHKEVTFQELYRELGFPDPKVVAQVQQGYLDYNVVFDVARKQGQFSSFAGTHPVFVRQWIKKMELRSAAFRRDKEAGLL